MSVEKIPTTQKEKGETRKFNEDMFDKASEAIEEIFKDKSRTQKRTQEEINKSVHEAMDTISVFENAIKEGGTWTEAALKNLDIAVRSEVPALEHRSLLIIQSNLPEIEKLIFSSNVSKNMHGLDAITHLLERGNNDQKKDGLRIIRKNITTLLGSIENEPLGHLYTESVSAFVGNGTKNDSKKIAAWLEKFVKKPAYTSVTPGRLLAGMLEYENDHGKKTRQVPEIILEKYGLDIQNLLEKWKHNIPEESYYGIIESNLDTIFTLEKFYPGSINTLLKDFDIENFGRYPISMLMRQYLNRDNKILPYGIVLYPKDDHNGAFYQTNKVLEQFFDSINEKYLVRIVECQTKIDIARTFIKLDNSYGDMHKIAFAIIGGHGEKNSISFGDPIHDRNTISKWDLLGGGFQRAGKFFEEGAIIVLNSCSTGAEKGVAQELSRIGFTVIAQDKSSNFKSVIGSVDVGGKLHIAAQYEEKSKARVYSKGKPEETEAL